MIGATRIKYLATALALIVQSLYGGKASGQELFVYTEPASNMPARSVGIRVSNWLMEDGSKKVVNYHLIPELMWGINKYLMVHAEGFASNRGNGMSLEGGAFYAKYRIMSTDRLYHHFRMALFGRAAINNGEIHQEEIETNGHNTGIEGGIIATQLLHKQAISSSVSYEMITANRGGNELLPAQAGRALNYTLSTGRLILPRDYAGYNQVNLNVMVEMLGQYLPENGRSFLDATASVQFIFNSQTRVDIGYKRQLSGNMLRTAPDGLLIRVEHLLFNVFR